MNEPRIKPSIAQELSLALARRFDSVTDITGKTVAWLAIAMVTIQCLIVLMRYGANIGSIALQESVMYLHAMLFMLGCAYTAKAQGHVRVDIFYRTASKRYKLWVNLVGNILLLTPFCLFILWTSWEYVAASWAVKESSAEANGLPMLYLIKSLIPILAISLLLHTVADSIRLIIQLRSKSNIQSSTSKIIT